MTHRSSLTAKRAEPPLASAQGLLSAAAATGTASRPLPLFYTLIQAGRAITAAWADDISDPRDHGLGWKRGSGVLDSIVKPASGGAFVQASKAELSPPLTQPVEVGAL
jgi:hypothetical protein